jgi:histidinol-phosphate aminotransferase
MYEFYAQLCEVNVETYQKEADLTIVPDKLIAFCKEKGAKGLIFSNPCNPTSLGLDRASVKKIIESLDGCLVILDEAYMDFWDQSVLSDVDKYDNLIILKTCSKAIGLAAVRFGFAVANKTITNAIRAAKSPYNNDTVAQTIAADILSEKEYLAECRDTIVANTKKLYSDILEIDKKYGRFGAIYEPCTNFVFIRTDEFEKIYSYMLENSIAIRKFKGYIRVTAGTEAENARFISVLDRYFKK